MSETNQVEPSREQTSGDDYDRYSLLQQQLAAAQARILELESQCGVKDEALRRVWDEDEMGWIKGGVETECVKCGAKKPVGINAAMVHRSDCLQGIILNALTTTSNTLVERVKGLETILESGQEIVFEGIRCRAIPADDIDQALTPTKASQ